MKKNDNNNKNELILLVKTENYLQHILDLILKLPRTEKFSIGTEYKSSLYEMLQTITYLHKIEYSKRMYYLNKIDALLLTQRIYLRIMKNNHWIDERKFIVAMEKISEIGKMIGGLLKYYGKNNSK